MTDELGQKARRSGRRKRLAKSAAPPKVNPAPPGQNGGSYQPLTNVELVSIYDTALRLLEELGMGEVPDNLAKVLVGAGAKAIPGDRYSFSREMVEEMIGKAAKTFTLHGRDNARSIEVGGTSVHFGTGGAAVQALDLET